MTLISEIESKVDNGIKSLAVLIDPDRTKTKNIETIVELSNKYNVDFYLVGGSILMEDDLDRTIRYLKMHSDKPVVLFPGNEMQIHPDADAILFLSLISGRNPEYLIGKHVAAAPKIKKMEFEAIPTGYLLIHGSTASTASYITNTLPIPLNKPELAVATAMAGVMLGHKLIYLEGGSGTSRPIPSRSINQVRKSINIPLIVGGGIRNPEKLRENYKAGADIQVIGTAFEHNPDLIKDFAKVKSEINQQLSKI